MVLREVKSFQYCNEKYIILENKEKDNNSYVWNYYITIKGYKSIIHIFGLPDKARNYDDVKDYVMNYFNSFYEEITGEPFCVSQERLALIKEGRL